MGTLSRRRLIQAGIAGVLTASATASMAAPAKGTRFPTFRAENLAGQVRTEQDLIGRQTLVVVVTTPAAAERMTEWIRAAQAKYPDAQLRRVVFLALSLSSLVPAFLVRDKAKGKVPRAYWKDTFVDAHGALVAQLGVPAGSNQPFVYVLDAASVVRAHTMGPLDDRRRAEVFGAVEVR